MRYGLKEKTLVGGCVGEENGWNTQLLYFMGSSLSRDDKLLFMISDKGGSPNIVMRDLEKGTEKTLTQNSNGTMKSYVYFDCRPGIGLSKASVCLDAERRIAYFIQDNSICRVGEDGVVAKLADVPADRVTAFTHVSADGKLLCVPMTDVRALDYDPETEGSGLDRRPIYNIDGRIVITRRTASTSARWFPTGTGESSRGFRSASIRASGSDRTRTRIPSTPMTEDASSSTAEADAT